MKPSLKPWKASVGMLVIAWAGSAAAAGTAWAAPVPGAPGGGPASGDAYTEAILAALEARGIQLPEPVRAQLDAVGALLDGARLDALALTRGGGRNAWAVDVEGCTGPGACGGHYVGTSNETSYFVTGNYTGSVTCSHNTVMLNVVIESGDVCYAPTYNQVCVNGQCESPTPPGLGGRNARLPAGRLEDDGDRSVGEQNFLVEVTQPVDGAA